VSVKAHECNAPHGGLTFLRRLPVFKNLLAVAGVFVTHVGSFPLAMNYFRIFATWRGAEAGLVNGLRISLMDEW
jgi:hypothetical protein